MAWKVWLGTALNFFLLGAGYLLFTPRKVLGACLTIGAVLATWVEQVPLAAMEDPTPYRVMVASICCMAVGCAVDGYGEIKRSLASQ